MSPTDPILDAAEVPAGNHPAPPPVARQSLTDRLFDRALTLAVQLGAAKAQIAILTQSLQAAQRKAAEAQAKDILEERAPRPGPLAVDS